MNHHRCWAEIDSRTLLDNISTIRNYIGPNVKFAAMLKSNAYGHGIVEIGKMVAEHSDCLNVATLEEASLLRNAGLSSQIIVLAPLLHFEADEAVTLNTTPLIESFEIAKALSDAAVKQNKTVNIHIKLDTGMSRFGIYCEKAVELAQQVSILPNLHIEGICSHFACADIDPERTACQVDKFAQTSQQVENTLGCKLIKHLSNSPGLVNGSGVTFDMVRPGLLLYGLLISPKIPVKPVLTWKTRVSSVRSITPGSIVGYSATFQARRPTLIATLAVGYADGYLRTLSNKGVVLVRGEEATIAGRVCMDQMMIDITDIPGVQIGDEVTLVGGSVPAHRLSKLAETTIHQIPTGLGPRVVKIYN